MAKVTRQRVISLKKKKAVKKLVRNSSNGAVTGSFVSKITTVQDSPTGGITLALYGRSGTGKTTFACTFPKRALLIRVGMDDGVLSVKDVDGVDTTPLVRDPDQISEIVQEQRENNTWKTLILDTASELQNVTLQKVVGLNSAPTQLSWGVARQEQWGDVAVGMKDKMRDLLDLATTGTHIIIISQERDFSKTDATPDSELAVPNVAQALSPSVVGWLNPVCNYVCQMFIRAETNLVEKRVMVGKKTKIVKRKEETGNYEYCLRTGAHDVYTVRLRMPKGSKVPDVLTDPDFKKFYEVISRTGERK